MQGRRADGIDSWGPADDDLLVPTNAARRTAGLPISATMLVGARQSRLRACRLQAETDAAWQRSEAHVHDVALLLEGHRHVVVPALRTLQREIYSIQRQRRLYSKRYGAAASAGGAYAAAAGLTGSSVPLSLPHTHAHLLGERLQAIGHRVALAVQASQACAPLDDVFCHLRR